MQACGLRAGQHPAAGKGAHRIGLPVAEGARDLIADDVAQSGGSQRIHCVLLMSEPPSIDGNELTDKGYINQRAALHRRAAWVRQLYAEPPDAELIVMPD